jgi:hypothetical protein
LVIVALAVKWRVNITEVNRLVFDIFPQYFKVIAVKEGILIDGCPRHMSPGA